MTNNLRTTMGPLISRSRRALALAALLVSLPLEAQSRPAATPTPSPGSRCLSLASKGPLAFLGRTDALVIMNLANPSRPKEVGSLPLRHDVRAVAVLSDTSVVLAAGNGGVVVVDVSDPAAPRAVSRFETHGPASGLAVRGSLAAIAEDIEGVRLLDLSDPERPHSLAVVPTRSRVRAVAIDGSRLVTAEGDGGMRVFDIASSSAPREQAIVRGTFLDVAIDHGVLLAAAGRQGLLIFDLRGSRPAALATVPPIERAESVAILGTLAAISEGGEGVQLVDVSDPASPRVLSRVRLPRGFSAGRGLLQPGRLLLAGDLAGLALVDVSDPAKPDVLLPRRRALRIAEPSASNP